jgi:hypothetical protein
MANTFTKISSVTVGAGGAGAVDFTSIPNTYADLCIKVSARKTSTGGSNLQLQLNGDTSGSSYVQRMLLGNGSTVLPYADASESIGFMYVNLSSDTADTFNNTEIYIPNYTSSFWKSMNIDSVTENNLSSGAGNVLTAGLWKSTATITRVYLYIANGAGTFAQHSTATLYGISKS